MSEESDMVTAYLYAAELAKDAMKKLKAENEQLKAEFQRVYGVEIPQGFCYRNYVLLKADLSEANKQISALKLSLKNSEREVLSMRAKTEHLPEFVNMEVERLNIQIRNLTYQRKELMKTVEKLEFEVYQKRNRGS
jgi:uncharacterized protein YpmS